MSKNVLIIDDDKVCNFLTVNSLKKAGITGEIEVKLNGEDAINYLMLSPDFPDLILLDINMPIMSGLDFLKKYEEKGFSGKSKIAMYTSSIRKADEEIAYQFPDVLDFIHKPIAKDKLNSLLERL